MQEQREDRLIARLKEIIQTSRHATGETTCWCTTRYRPKEDRAVFIFSPEVLDEIYTLI